MKPFRALFLLTLLYAPYQTVLAEKTYPRATEDFQTIKNRYSRDVKGASFLFKNFKIFVPFDPSENVKAPAGWRTLNPLEGIKEEDSDMVVEKVVFLEYQDDLFCWYWLSSGAASNDSEGEEGWVEGNLVRLSGKDLKPLWASRQASFDKKSCLIQKDALYVVSYDSINKVGLTTGEFLWQRKSPFTGYTGTFKKPVIKDGICEARDEYERVLDLDDTTGKILKVDYSAVPRNRIPAQADFLIMAYGGYSTYEMFQDHADGLAWVTGGSCGLGLLDTIFFPSRTDQTSSNVSPVFIPGMILACPYPLIATIDGYINNKNDVVTRGWIGMGSETLFFILMVDATQQQNNTKVFWRPQLSPRYAGLTGTFYF